MQIILCQRFHRQQIIFLILFLLFIPGFLSGEGGNLLQEWERPVLQKGTRLLPQWRFAQWGKGKNSPQMLLRSHKIQLKEGKLSVILESKLHASSANVLLRTYSFKETDKRLFRFTVKAVNTMAGKALLRVRLAASGSRYAVKEKLFSVSSDEKLYSAALKVPEKSRSVTIQICLSGPGRVILSAAHLSAEEPLQELSTLRCILPEGTFLIPERSPVLFPVKLPVRRPLPADGFVSVTLPWGIRLINSSFPATGEGVKIVPGKSTVTRLKFPAKRNSADGWLYLLLGTDLPVSGETRTGSITYEDPHGKSEHHFFHLKIVKDLSVLPPRSFRIMLNGSEKVPSLESVEDTENALLRSGANILNAPYLTISCRTLRNARIKQYCEFHLPPAPVKQHCSYAMIRNESFWEKHFAPHLRRKIPRMQTSPIQAILCDSYLGQRRGIECLCALCRAELADFAPKLPPQAVINYSKELLNSRFSKELQKFRTARLTALCEGARYHLPTGKTAFARAPQLIPCYTASQILWQNISLFSSSEAIVDFYKGADLPEDSIYHGAANFILYEAVRKKARVTLPRKKVFAKIVPSPRHIPPERVQFEMLNILFCGYSGVWCALPPGAGWNYSRSIAETADLIREYENFFNRGITPESPWHLSQGNFTIELPPMPSGGLYRQETPSGIPGLQLRVWQKGKETLIGVGNFSESPRNCTLSNKELPRDKYVKVGQNKFSGKELAEKGIELTIPPCSWKFLKLDLTSL